MRPTRDNPRHFRDHPAVLAWAAHAGSSQGITGVEVLKEDGRSRVYRLVTEDPREPNLIAKSSSRERLARERAAYERLLPRVTAAVPRYRGFAAGRRLEPSYLFVDEVAGEAYSAADSGHRVLAGEWLGRFHVASSELADQGGSREKASRQHRDLLRQAGATILECRALPTLGRGDLTVLAAILAQCELITKVWERIEEACARFPLCHVHGDFKADNLRVVATPSGRLELVVFDWSSAERQTAAVDVAAAFTRTFSKKPVTADIQSYCAVVRRQWPFLDVPRLRRLACLGEVFRWTKSIRWAAEELRHDWPGQAIYLLRLYRSWMEGIVAVAPWRKDRAPRDRLETMARRSAARDTQALP